MAGWRGRLADLAVGIGVVAAVAGVVVGAAAQGRRGEPEYGAVRLDGIPRHPWPCASCELIARWRAERAARTPAH